MYKILCILLSWNWTFVLIDYFLKRVNITRYIGAWLLFSEIHLYLLKNWFLFFKREGHVIKMTGHWHLQQEKIYRMHFRHPELENTVLFQQLPFGYTISAQDIMISVHSPYSFYYKRVVLQAHTCIILKIQCLILVINMNNKLVSVLKEYIKSQAEVLLGLNTKTSRSLWITLHW